MICRSCLRRAATSSRRMLLSSSSTPSSRAAFSTSLPTRSPASYSAGSPPLTDPLTPPPPGDAPAESAAPAKSSCAPGTVLIGLSYVKGQTDPVALRDEEYPAWLWDCLDVQKKAADAEAEDAGDAFSKSKKQRRIAAKKQRELEAKILATGDLGALAPKIPLQQQSINLPGKEDGTVEDALFAANKREELRQAMRKERKAKIKESNYLKSM